MARATDVNQHGILYIRWSGLLPDHRLPCCEIVGGELQDWKGSHTLGISNYRGAGPALRNSS